MNAGKSTLLLQCNHNYNKNNMETLILSPQTDDRYGHSTIRSRIGLSAESIAFDCSVNLYKLITKYNDLSKRHCVFVDEAQFLTTRQVDQLSDICDYVNIPVITYGLRTDSKGELFEGSMCLLALADNIIEVKTICHAHKYGYPCDHKATMVLRTDEHGNIITDGPQIMIGDHEYITVCRRHYKIMRNIGNVCDTSRPPGEGI
jgi:thymidine kinase